MNFTEEQKNFSISDLNMTILGVYSYFILEEVLVLVQETEIAFRAVNSS